jgi:hypothetical protein
MIIDVSIDLGLMSHLISYSCSEQTVASIETLSNSSLLSIYLPMKSSNLWEVHTLTLDLSSDLGEIPHLISRSCTERSAASIGTFV